MIHLLKLFSRDIMKYWAILILGLFLAIFIAENGAALNVELIEKYKYLFLAGLGLILLDRSIYFLKYHRFIILPYSLSLHNKVIDEQKETKVSVKFTIYSSGIFLNKSFTNVFCPSLYKFTTLKFIKIPFGFFVNFK